MSIKNYDLSVQAEGVYYGRRQWTGTEAHVSWSVVNENDNNRGEWTSVENVSSPFHRWLEFRSRFSTYCMRYNDYDLDVEETDLETVMMRGGIDKFELGVMFKFRDKNNYYAVTYTGGDINFGGGNFRLVRRRGTTTTSLGLVTVPEWEQQEKKKVRVYSKAGVIKVWLDDELIFDIVDPFPHLKGAFGPIVKGQQFARYEYFTALSFSSFNANVSETNLAVESIYSTPENSFLVINKTISDYLDKSIVDFLSKISMISYEIVRYTIQSSNSRVNVIFDKQPNTRVSINPNSYIYSFVSPPTIPPVEVTNLTGLALSESQIKLAWQHNGVDVDGFYIVNEAGELIATVNGTARDYIETGLEQGTTYTRYIIAFNGAGNASASNIIRVTTLYFLPDMPTDFNGIGINDSSIKWTWADNSDNETEFEIVDLTSGTEVIVARISPDTTEWIETGLKELTTYYRYIRSSNPRGTSRLSNEAAATTTEKLPDPPKYEPYNFEGVGISHDTILWGWSDKNLDADGFVFFDRQGKELFRIPYNITHYESGLLSDNEFGRSIAAYNRGGIGPATPIVYAKTHPYGYTTNLAPVAPINLTFHNLTFESATLVWEYVGNDLVPHEGFYIYTDADLLVGEVGPTTLSFELEGLVSDTVYSYYVKAFNKDGLSLASNIVQFATEPIETEDSGFTEEIADGFVDKLSGVTYDYETEDTPKIQAFADGIGDSLDLVVHNLKELVVPKEKFDIISKIKAIYEVETTIYPEVPIKARVTTRFKYPDGTEETVETAVDAILKAKDKEIVFAHNFDMYLVFGDKTAYIEHQYVDILDELGQVVKPSTHPHIKTAVTKEVYDLRVGEVADIRMDNVFSQWEKFNHSGSNQTTPSADFWVYDPYRNAIMTTKNLSSYTGAVSPDKYESYEFLAHLTSTDNDDDVMGLVLAYNVDDKGKQHTLSALRRRDGSGSNKHAEWSIVYNFAQGSEVELASMRYDTANTDWNDHPEGIRIKAIREGNVFTVYTSPAGSKDIDMSTKLSVDISSYHIMNNVFSGSSHIGIAARSQDKTALRIEEFVGQKIVISERYHVYASTTYETKQIHYEEWFGREDIHRNNIVRNDDVRNISVKVQSPVYQAGWQLKAASHRFIPNSYVVSLSSTNPNVYLEYEKTHIDVDSGELYFPVNATAKIINIEQTPWHPHIHNGYYYMKHREHFLYSETDVLAELDSDIEVLEYTFPYDIEVQIETNQKEQLTYKVIDTAAEMIKGTVDDNILIDLINDTMTTKYMLGSSVYVTPTYTFTSPIVDWSTTNITGNNLVDPDGKQLYKLEIAPIDVMGNPVAWYPIDSAPAMTEAQLRMEITPSVAKEYSKAAYESSKTEIQNGYMVNIDNALDGSYIKVLNPEANASGTFITLPKTFLQTVAKYDEIKIRMNLPEGTSVNIFSVSADSYTHTFNVPTSSNPWIPAPFLRKEDEWYIYKNNATPNVCMAVVIELVTAFDDTPTIYEYALDATLVEDKMVVPVIEKIEFGGKMEESDSILEYTIPRIATIVSDGAWKEITEFTVEEEVRRYMSSIGYVLTENSHIKEYEYEVDPNLPVELDGDYLGLGKLKARTTEEVGDAAYRQKKITIDKNGSAVIRPIPQNGKPLIVRNAQGVLMRQVHALDSNYEPTLTITEHTKTLGGRYLFMENLAHQIDLRTMNVLIYKDGRWIRIYGATVVQNRIILPTSYEAGLDVRISYKLKNSYIVDYNYDTDKDYALITVHMDYNEEVVETKVLNVIYETNKVHPYYIAEEINLNPMLNKVAKGFLYITDDIHPAERLEMRVKRTASATNKEQLIVHVYAMDIYGNPVVDQPISLKSDGGKLSVKTFETDENGMVIAKLDLADVKTDTVTISAESIVYRGFTLELKEVIDVHHEVSKQNVRIIADSLIERDVPHTITISTLGENYEFIPNVPVTIRSSKGSVIPNVITDYLGNSTFTLTVNSSEVSGSNDFVIIEVETATSKEAMILGVKEV